MQRLLGVLSLLAVTVSSTWAAEAPVMLEAKIVEGKLDVRKAGGDPVALEKGGKVGKGSQVRGTKGSFAILVGPDGSRVKLEGETVLEVVDFGKLREFKIDRGMAMFQAAPGPARSFLVRTRSAVMGVRGTQFFVSYAPSGGDEWMCVKEGEVEVSTPKNEQSLTLVKAGQGVRVETNGKITPPEKFAWTEKLKWDMDSAAVRMDEDLLKGTYEDVRVRNYD